MKWRVPPCDTLSLLAFLLASSVDAYELVMLAPRAVGIFWLCAYILCGSGYIAGCKELQQDFSSDRI